MSFTEIVLIGVETGTAKDFVNQCFTNTPVINRDGKLGSRTFIIKNHEELELLRKDIIQWAFNCLKSFDLLTAKYRGSDTKPEDIFSAIKAVTVDNSNNRFNTFGKNNIVNNTAYEMWLNKIKLYNVYMESNKKDYATHVLISLGQDIISFCLTKFYSCIICDLQDFVSYHSDLITARVVEQSTEKLLTYYQVK